MQHAGSRVVASLALLLGACGPPDPSSEGGTTTNIGETGEPTSSTDAGGSSSESGSSSTDESDTEIDDDGAQTSFDHFDMEELSTCDPWFQDCPVGEKCMPYASSGQVWDAHKCVPLLGDQAVGEPCTYGGVEEGTDDCNATSMCWNTVEIEGELLGTCTPFCTGTPDTPGCPVEGYFCNLTGDGTLSLCLQTCDPLAQDCGAGLGCYWSNVEFICTVTAGDLATGAPCGFVNDCAPGNSCIDGELFPDCEGSACCAAFCDLDLGDGPCDDVINGTVCTPYFEEPPPGYETLGACTLPQP